MFYENGEEYVFKHGRSEYNKAAEAASLCTFFVLDRDGIVRYTWITEDPTVEPDYGAIEKALQEIK